MKPGEDAVRSHRLVALAVLSSALVLRCLAIARFSLGNDEIEEVRFSRLPWRDLLHALAESGGHPPLEFLVQALISRTGAPEWIHRVPSVLFGVGGVVLAMFLSRRWFGRIAGLVTGVLLAFSPIHVRYSQEVRPYALGLLLMLGAVAALEAYRERPRRSLAFLWFASTLGAMYTLYFAGMLSVLVGVCFVIQNRRAELERLWRTLPVALAGWALLYLPWMPAAISIGRRQPAAGREILNRSWLTYRLQTMGTGDWRVEPLSAGSWLFWGLVVIGLAQAYRSRFAVLATAWLTLGGVSQVLFLQVRPHYSAVRYLLPSWLASVLLAGYTVHLASRNRALLALASAAVCVVVVADVRTLADYYDHGRPRWDAVVEYLMRHSKPGDHIATTNWWTHRNLSYYWSDEHLGRTETSLEYAYGTISGPAWVVSAECPMSPEAQREFEALELKAAFPTTNYCEIRYLSTGDTLREPEGMCLP